MISEKQRELARKFQKMHKSGEMFILPNVWNAGSAVVFEKEGFKALATTSAGIAYSLGYSDGEDIDITDLRLLVNQISRRINIPLSVDFERGYSNNIEEIKKNATYLLNAGAVGFNIEDGKTDGTLDDLDFMIDKIKALVDLKKEMNVDFVINARTCTYWLNIAEDKKKMQIAVERGNAFKKAGADCVFIPGVLDKKTIKNLVEEIDAPVNIILNPKYNDFDGLNKLGVVRLSVGSGPVRSSFNHLIDMAKNLHNNNIDMIVNHEFDYKKANEYFDKM